MSKTRKYQFEEFEDDDYDISNVRPMKQNKRQQRRMDHALKTKNVDELMDVYDDEIGRAHV